MVHFIVIGIILGVPAGLAPGPLLALVISETLQHNIKSGIKVAVAPVLTDLPLLLLTFFILAKLSAFHHILGIISLVGGGVVFFMGVQSLMTTGFELNIQIVRPASLAKGMLANVLNPHPYLFWLSVGGPIMARAAEMSLGVLLAFLIGFYTMLVGAKILIAIMVGQSKTFLNGRAYEFALRFIGLALCGVSFLLFRDGLELLELI